MDEMMRQFAEFLANQPGVQGPTLEPGPGDDCWYGGWTLAGVTYSFSVNPTP